MNIFSSIFCLRAAVVQKLGRSEILNQFELALHRLISGEASGLNCDYLSQPEKKGNMYEYVIVRKYCTVNILEL